MKKEMPHEGTQGNERRNQNVCCVQSVTKMSNCQELFLLAAIMAGVVIL